MGWSMDRQGVRTSFDSESRRLKQVELSGARRERLSLAAYPDELSAREAELGREAKYGQWGNAAGRQNRNKFAHSRAKSLKTRKRQSNGYQ
jgi:hypothetical protein